MNGVNDGLDLPVRQISSLPSTSAVLTTASFLFDSASMAEWHSAAIEKSIRFGSVARTFITNSKISTQRKKKPKKYDISNKIGTAL